MVPGITDEYDIENLRLYSITFKDSCFYDISKDDLKERVYKELYSIVNGLAVLNTCNRFEVYLDVYTESVASNELLKLMGSYHSSFHKYNGIEVVRHLFRVSSGLESAILGENEILSQVKESWEESKSKGLTSKLIDSLFHWSIIVGKKVRAQTHISSGVLGYPQASVEIARRVLGGLDGKKVMIIGAGRASKAIIDYICSRWRPSEVHIANRTKERAEALVRDGCRFKVTGLGEIFDKGYDVVFIALKGGPFDFLDELPRKNKLIIDISTPTAMRSTKPTFTIDDVHSIVGENYEKRLTQAKYAEAIITHEVSRFMDYLAKRRVDDRIAEIMGYLDAVIEREVLRTKKNVEKGVDVEEAIRVALRSFTKKSMKPIFDLLHESPDSEIYKEIVEHYRREFGGKV
ncbi:MAG: NAD(P)-binding domain-containing protein [Caldisphaeraceae archaeon]|nr:NAD(P)-binding domain-containing protein [Caldisphaeraceae archaeon]MEB3798207.1 NAD(P)-binding domain-containing protein [Caldisphaeraceae archaeon]